MIVTKFGQRIEFVDDCYEAREEGAIVFDDAPYRCIDFASGVRMVFKHGSRHVYSRLTNGLCFYDNLALLPEQLENPTDGIKLLLNHPLPPSGGVNCADLIMAPPPVVIHSTVMPAPPPLPTAPGAPRKLPPPTDTRGFENAVVVSDYHDAIIPLDISDPREPRVNARDLHAFMEIGKVFGAWITERIEGIGFVQDEDFTVVSKSGKNPQGGRPAKEYLLSLDMAKQLSMIERNEKGKQARRYFIECEKRLRNMPTVPALDFSDRLSMLKLIQETTQEAIVAEEGRLIAVAEVKVLTEEVVAQSVEKEELQQQFNLIAAKVDVGERCVTFKQFFKETEAELGFTSKTGYQYLRDAGILVHGQETKWDLIHMPAAEYALKGLFRIQQRAYRRPDENPDLEVEKPTVVVKKPVVMLTTDTLDADGNVIKMGGYRWLFNRILKDPCCTLARLVATNGGQDGVFKKLYGCRLVRVSLPESLENVAAGPAIINFLRIGTVVEGRRKPLVSWEVARHIGDGKITRGHGVTLAAALSELNQVTPKDAPKALAKYVKKA